MSLLHLPRLEARWKCWEAWRTFCICTDQSITALIAWRKAEWRKEVPDVPSLEAPEWSVFNQTNIGTVSRATLRGLLKDWVKRVWSSLCTTMTSWAETGSCIAETAPTTPLFQSNEMFLVACSTTTIIIIIIIFKGAIQDFLQSPHRATNRFQHVRLSGIAANVCKWHATHWALITCNMSFFVPHDTKGQLSN